MENGLGLLFAGFPFLLCLFDGREKTGGIHGFLVQYNWSLSSFLLVV